MSHYIGSGVVDAPSTKNFASSVLDALGITINMIVENNNRLKGAITRAYGPEPAPPSQEKGANPIATGHIGSAMDQLREINSLLEIQKGLLNRLEGVI